jgi:hypothetical protein
MGYRQRIDCRHSQTRTAASSPSSACDTGQSRRARRSFCYRAKRRQHELGGASRFFQPPRRSRSMAARGAASARAFGDRRRVAWPRLLQELIRTVIAVEAQPASRLLEAFGVDPASIPPGLNIPRGPTWPRLIRWLLSLGQSLPPSAVPDVADLYIKWLTGFFGAGPYTRQVLVWLHYWLTAIENGGDSGPGNWRSVFSGFSYEQMKALEAELRTGFLLFCNRAPDLAVQYARAQLILNPVN